MNNILANSIWFPITNFGGKYNAEVWMFVHVAVMLPILFLMGFLYLQKKSCEKSINKLHTKCTVGYNNRLLSRLPIFRLIDGFLTLNNFRKDGVKYLEYMYTKFGKLIDIRLGYINILGIADADVVQKVLTSTDFHHLNKPRPIYDYIFTEFLRDGLVSAETKLWAPHRKIMSRSFTYKSLCSYVKFMNTHSRNLAIDLLQSARLNSEASNGVAECITGAEMYEMIYFHTIKIISEITMGLDCCTADEASKFHKSTSAWKQIVIQRFLNPILLISPIWWFHPLKKESDKHVKELADFMNTIIKRYRAKQKLEEKLENAKLNTDANKNAVSAGKNAEAETIGEKPFRCLIEEMICSNATDKEILEEFATILMAGHESVATTTRMLLFNLALNPEHQSACRQEVDSIFQSKIGEDYNNQDLTMDDLTDLKYVERCILESLRVTPTFPLFLRRLDAPLTIDDDFHLDKGTNVTFMAWCLHKDPKHFPDPEKFDPDRFLPDNIKERHPYAFIPFSAGPRNCIGYKVAMMELKCIIAWILRHFEISTTDGPNDVKLLFEVALLPERPHKITLTKRQN